MPPLFFLRLKNFFSVEKYALLKLFLLLLIVYFSVWKFAGLESFVRRKLYGEEHVVEVYENNEVIEDYFDYSAGKAVDVKGHVIYKVAKKKYSVSGIFAAHKTNRDFINYSLANFRDEDKKTYMDISPDNISVVWGKKASLAPIKCDFDQTEVSYVKCGKEIKEEECHVNNYHIIPANKAIEKAVSTLPEHPENKNIYLEGFLIDWDTVESKDGEYRFKTALSSGETIPTKREEVKLRKNFQLYLTRIVYDGYEFK